VFPVQDDFGNVLGRLQRGILFPLVPVNSHCAIFVHATRGKTVYSLETSSALKEKKNLTKH